MALFNNSASKQQIMSEASQKLRIVQYCADIINNTDIPEAFFSRYDMLLENLEDLSKLEKTIKFTGEKPSKALYRIQSERDEIIDAFIDRAYAKANDNASLRKTEDAKTTVFAKFFSKLEEYDSYMSQKNISHIENLRRKHFDFLDRNLSEDVLHCIYCKNVLSKNANFCSKCGKPVSNNAQVNNSVSKAASSPQQWKVTAAFGKSTSVAFTRALCTAQQSSYSYEEHNVDGQIVYQATYTSNPDSFLKFIQLHNLIKNWKTSAFYINGEIVDLQTIACIISCYGEKCRTGNKRYCYGNLNNSNNSNPFGCHRLQLNSTYNGWFTYNKRMTGWYIIDKKALKDIIDQYSKTYHFCPCFDYNNIISNLQKLPERISQKQMNELNPYGYL